MVKPPAVDARKVFRSVVSDSISEIDGEMIEHLSWIVEERTDIVNELTKLQA